MSKKKSVFEVTNVDFIFREIMHSNISVEDGLNRCVDEKEVKRLLHMLRDCGEID